MTQHKLFINYDFIVMSSAYKSMERGNFINNFRL